MVRRKRKCDNDIREGVGRRGKANLWGRTNEPTRCSRNRKLAFGLLSLDGSYILTLSPFSHGHLGHPAHAAYKENPLVFCMERDSTRACTLKQRPSTLYCADFLLSLFAILPPRTPLVLRLALRVLHWQASRDRRRRRRRRRRSRPTSNRVASQITNDERDEANNDECIACAGSDEPKYGSRAS